MKKAVLLFWGKGGNVERAAHKVYAKFDPAQIDMFDVASFDRSTIINYDLVILGGSTIGAEVWTDVKDDNEWSRFFSDLKDNALQGKLVAFFGLGDQVLYPDHYVDALGVFKEEMEKKGAKLIGRWSTEGYRFTDSDGYDGKLFFGLALDEDRQEDLTEERVNKWIEILKKEAGF